MSLKERLNEDLKSAMRKAATEPQEKIRVSVIRLLNAEIKNAEILKHGQLTDDEITEIVQRQIKRRRESIELYKKGGREDLAEKEDLELHILSSYMPAQLSDNELREIIKSAIEEIGTVSPREMGKVIGSVMPKVKGRADGKRVSEMVSALLRAD